MTLKLTKTEFKTVYSMLTVALHTEGVKPMSEEGLQHTILTALWKRFYDMAGFLRPKYKIKLQPHESQAFWLWFNDHEYGNITYEGQLLNRICYNIFTYFDTKTTSYENFNRAGHYVPGINNSLAADS